MLVDQYSTEGVDRVANDVAGLDVLRLKQAADASNDAPPKHAAGYAFPQQRLFPVHTAQATILSSAYAAVQRKQAADTIPPAVVAEIDAAATAFGVTDVVTAIRKAADATDTSTTTQQFIDQVRGMLHYGRPHFSFDECRKWASQAILFAEDHAVPLSEEEHDGLRQLTGQGVCTGTAAGSYLRKVASVCDEEAASTLTRTADLFEREAFVDPAVAEKCAATVDATWRKIVASHNDIPAPETVLFAVDPQFLRKVAEQSVTLPSGYTVLNEDLSKLRPREIADFLGTKAAAALMRNDDAGSRQAVINALSPASLLPFEELARAKRMRGAAAVAT